LEDHISRGAADQILLAIIDLSHCTEVLAYDDRGSRSSSLLGGKLDTPINPTRIDLLTRNLPLAWFESYVIATVPAYRRGRTRWRQEVLPRITCFIREQRTRTGECKSEHPRNSIECAFRTVTGKDQC
jgi:poly-beta-hydroxyalkanoate depolymerase